MAVSPTVLPTAWAAWELRQTSEPNILDTGSLILFGDWHSTGYLQRGTQPAICSVALRPHILSYPHHHHNHHRSPSSPSSSSFTFITIIIIVHLHHHHHHRSPSSPSSSSFTFHVRILAPGGRLCLFSAFSVPGCWPWQCWTTSAVVFWLDCDSHSPAKKWTQHSGPF